MTIEHISFRRYDIIIGGSFIHLSDALHHTVSIPYDYDDIIFCIQRSKIIPKYLNIVNILPPEMWFTMIFIGIFFIGIIAYLVVQFDSGVKRRNQMDLNYIMIIHLMSSFFSNAHDFKPKTAWLRILHTIIIVISLVFQGIVGVSLYQYMKEDMFYHQITTLREIVDSNFRLAGSPEVLHMIKRTELVSCDLQTDVQKKIFI